MRIPWFLGNSSGFDFWPLGFILLACWSVVWTGLALWYAAKRDEKGWFILFLIVHTAGIVELLYLLFVVKMKPFTADKKLRRQKK